MGALLAALGALGAAAFQVMRALPLVHEGAPNDGCSSKVAEMMDMKKKGNGPRTRRKKAKKGK